MDRRLVLAVIISALILFAYQLFLGPSPADRPLPPSPGSGETTATALGGEEVPEPATAIPERDRAPVSSLISNGGEAREVEVRTELYTASFTSLGGRLSSWQLHRFHRADGEPVEIVNDHDELGLILETPEGPVNLDEAVYELRQETVSEGQRLTFETRGSGGLSVTKTYTLPDDGYLIDLAVSIQGAADATDYRLTWLNGIPPAESNGKQYKSAAGSIVLLGGDFSTTKPGSFKKEPLKEMTGNVRWAGVRNKYFTAIMIPPPETSSSVWLNGDPAAHTTGAQVVMPLLRGHANDAFQVYLGPMEYDRLRALGHDLDRAVDLGFRFIRPLSQLLLTVMVWMYGFIPNYGVIIILLSTATKFMFYPLTKSSLQSMKAMQKLQPQMQSLREKYKSDPKRMQAETMKLYKENKVNPLGGCLPIVVQMPVFIALYAVLANSIRMRQADFIWWINDLSTPDTLLSIGSFPIHLLPIVMFLTTFLQQRLTPQTDPRQKMMGYMMPAVMLFIFYSFPAGLNLYWTVNNVLTVAQHWRIHREEPASTPAPSTA